MNINVQNLIIRRVVDSDIDVMVSHRITYLSEIMEKPTTCNIEQLHSDLRNYFVSTIKNGQIVALVAESEGLPVSYGAIVLRTVPGDFNSPTYLEGDILNMYTIPEARKQGISTLILKQLIKEANSIGVSKLSLHTTIAGEKMYRSAKFSEPVYPFLELAL